MHLDGFGRHFGDSFGTPGSTSWGKKNMMVLMKPRVWDTGGHTQVFERHLRASIWMAWGIILAMVSGHLESTSWGKEKALF